MLRKVVVVLTLCLFITSPIAAEGILSLEDKIADFTYLYEFIAENAPYLWVNERLRGSSWLERKSEFQSWIQDTKTDLEYYERINDIIQALNSGHTDVLSPEQYINNAQAGLLQKRLLESDVKEAYKYWQELIDNSYADRNWSFTARYIAGDYWAVSSRVMEIPVGARILEVEDENAHDYVVGSGADKVLFFSNDNLRNNIYSVQLPLPRKGEVKITYELENVKKQVIVPVSVIAQQENEAIKERNNVHTEILEENKIAYIKIRSFSAENVAKDRGNILSFFRSVKDYPYIIIDIRGNTGGTDYYWKNLLIAPLIEKSIYTNFYMTYRSGSYVQEAIESFFSMGKAAMTIGRKNLSNRMQLPPEVLTYEFYDPLKLPIKVNPQNSVGFKGDIILLIDDLVFSASESFAAFAKDTNWATLIGIPSGGGGISVSPLFFALPKSKLIIRMPALLGLNPDGSANKEKKTTPDIYVEQDPHDYIELYKKNINVEPEKDRVLRTTIELIGQEKVVSKKPEMKGFLKLFFQGYDGLYGYRVTTDFSKYEGRRIEKIRVCGAYNTDEQLIITLIGLFEGEAFSSRRLELAQKRLKSFNSHNFVGLDVKEYGEDGVELIVFVQEGAGLFLNPIEVSKRAIEDMLSERISLDYFNVYGKMINVKGVYGFGPRKERIIYAQGPLLFPSVGLKNSIQIGSSNSFRHEYQGEGFSWHTDFSRITGSTYITPDTQVLLKASYYREKLDSDLLLNDEQILVDVGMEVNSVLLDYSLLSKGSLGVLQDIESGNRYPYTEISIKKTFFTKNINTIFRADLGWCHPYTPLNHQWAVGGSNTFVAYPPAGLIGNRYAVAGMEVRRYFNNICVATIIDGGFVWDSQGQLDFNRPLSGIGVALRYLLPIDLDLEVLYAFDPSNPEVNGFRWGLSKNF